MSVLFPKINKPREWDYRPIYFDEEKEARKAIMKQKRQSKLLIWFVLIGLLVFGIYLFL